MLKALSLNVGRGLSSYKECLLFLEKQVTQGLDVACFQDISEKNVNDLRKIFGECYFFAPMCRHMYKGLDGQAVGIGIFTKNIPIESVIITAYVNNVYPINNLAGLDENGNHTDLALIRKTESRILLTCNLHKDGKKYSIATTHGVWVKGGAPDDHQRDGTNRLFEIVNAENLVLAGDMNFSRGGEIYKLFVKDRIHDCLPQTIDNTLDPVNHSLRGKLKIVSDYVFSIGDQYEVMDVNAEFGVSDHAGITFSIS